jgi:hypothetical protein
MAQPHKPTEPKGATLLALRKNSRAVAVRYPPNLAIFDFISIPELA